MCHSGKNENKNPKFRRKKKHKSATIIYIIILKFQVTTCNLKKKKINIRKERTVTINIKRGVSIFSCKLSTRVAQNPTKKHHIQSPRSNEDSGTALWKSPIPHQNRRIDDEADDSSVFRIRCKRSFVRVEAYGGASRKAKRVRARATWRRRGGTCGWCSPRIASFRFDPVLWFCGRWRTSQPAFRYLW